MALLILATSAIAGAEKQFPDFNFAVSIPDGWQEIADKAAQGGLAAGFCSADQTRMFLVFRDDRAAPAGELDDQFVTDYEQKIESTGGGKRLSGKFVIVQGIKSYERTGEGMWRGNKVTTLSRTIPLGDHLYLLRAMRWDGGRAEEDPAIRELMESFRFPSLPSTRDLVSVVPSEPAAASVLAESSAPSAGDEDLGKSLEKRQTSSDEMEPLLMTLAIVGGSLFVIVLIIVLVARRQKKSAAPAMPPPALARKAPGPPPSPAKTFAPAPLSKASAPSSAKAPTAPFLLRPPVAKASAPPPSAKPATPPPPAKISVAPPPAKISASPPSAKTVTPPLPVKAPAPPPVVDAPVAPPPTEASAPPPSTKPDAPPKASAPPPFVIRPRQTYRRE
ncbi:MAG: hypothetical protein ABJF10_01645 [Chthoniobacter sp.]|uniref:hypothetical protein n=1 Tax=Chthoniobacter sp. TaxID=2510640 RepID=UPI0032AC2C3C